MIGTTKFFIGIDVSKPHFDVALMAVVNNVNQEIALHGLTTPRQG